MFRSIFGGSYRRSAILGWLCCFIGDVGYIANEITVHGSAHWLSWVAAGFSGYLAFDAAFLKRTYLDLE